MRLDYNRLNDTDAYVEQQIVIGPYAYNVSAVTSSGRREPGSERKDNEDAFSIVHTDEQLYAVVFDGASSQVPIPRLQEQGLTGARYASHMLAELFEMRLARQEGCGEATLLLSGLNRTIGEHYRDYLGVDCTDLNLLPASTATIARFDAQTDTMDIGHVTDSFAIGLFDNGTTGILTDNRHLPFDTEVLNQIPKIATEDPANPLTNRQARNDPRIRALLMEMFQGRRNTPDGTGEGVVNGDPHMDQYIDASRFPLGQIKALLIGSDGIVPPGMSERNQADRTVLMHFARSMGVKGLLAYTRATEDADPDWTHVRYSHADDATAILIERA